MKIAIIGFGGMGNNHRKYIIPRLNDSDYPEKLDIAGIYDISEERKEFAAQLGLHNLNSALITPVGRTLFGDHPLAGVYFQRRMEREAFSRTGSYNAPVQRLEDFLAGRKSTFFGEVKPTYPGAALAECKGILPAAAEETLKAAVTDMDRRLKGFASPDAVITFPESRTSSPVRIERDSRCRSISADNLYPAGEGAGYSGGITSSAADGLRVADAIVERLLNGED